MTGPIRDGVLVDDVKYRPQDLEYALTDFPVDANLFHPLLNSTDSSPSHLSFVVADL